MNASKIVEADSSEGPVGVTTNILSDPPWPRRSYAWYVAGILTAAYTLSYIDRQVLGLLLEPIRRALTLTDTQVSLLAGSAFALFYVTLGLPLGRLADRTNRRNLIIAGVFCWSLATALCGLAGSFWQLFAARVGVGIGEAALSPAALSLISDYFPPEKRARPLTLYSLALAVGTGIAYLAGGSISAAIAGMPQLHLPVFGDVSTWQATFIAVGTPGMVFALLLLSIREPQRRGVRMTSTATGQKAGRPPVASIAEVLRFIWRENRGTFVVLFFAYGGFALYADAIIIWLPTLFSRRFGWSSGHIGVAIGLVILICATLGILGSMWLATRLQARQSADALPRTSFVLALALVPAGIALPLMSNPIWVLILLAPVMALSFGLFAMVFPILQLIAPNQMRAQISSIFSLFNNVIGLMAGATSVALLTDYVFHDRALLHYSLALVALIVLPVSALLTGWGLPHIRRSVVTAQSWMGATAARR